MAWLITSLHDGLQGIILLTLGIALSGSFSDTGYDASLYTRFAERQCDFDVVFLKSKLGVLIEAIWTSVLFRALPLIHTLSHGIDVLPKFGPSNRRVIHDVEVVRQGEFLIEQRAHPRRTCEEPVTAEGQIHIRARFEIPHGAGTEDADLANLRKLGEGAVQRC